MPISLQVVLAHAGAIASSSPGEIGKEHASLQQAEAGRADPRIESVHLIWGGVVKPGLWLPVQVALSGGTSGASGDLVLMATDSEGTLCAYPFDRVDVGWNEVRTVEALVRLGRSEGDVIVEWRLADGRNLRSILSPGGSSPGGGKGTPFEQLIVVQIGPTPIAENREGGSATSIRWLSVADPALLPESGDAYQMISAVVLTTGSDSRFIEKLRAADEACEGLRDWVASGGRLILSVDEAAAELFRQGGPLNWALPDGIQGSVQLRKTSALESYAESPRPIVIRRGESYLKAVQSPGFRGRVLAKEGNIPLIFRRQYGFGTVILCTVDLSHRAIRDWTQKDRLLERLLDCGESPGEQGLERRTLMHHGFNDLSGQLRAALEEFPGVVFIPFSTVAILMGVYFLLVGPLDYLVLGRYFPDRRWTWLTFPLIVVVVCIFAWQLAEAWKGRGVLVNEVGLIDLDVENERARGITWANLFSSQPEVFDVFPEPSHGDALGLRVTAASVGWFASPGGGLGGMEGARLGVGDVAGKYTIHFGGPSARLEGLPVAAKATRAVSAVVDGKMDRPLLQSRLTDQQGLLDGSVTNQFPFALDGAVMIYRGWVYFVGRLEPGAAWRPQIAEDRRELRSWLNGRRVETIGEGVQQQARQVTAPYDRSSRDVWYILRMMLLYRAAGGEGYVKLWNAQYAGLDGTDWLENGRAILLARADTDAGTGTIAVKPGEQALGKRPRYRSVLYVRAVCPVEGAESGAETNQLAPPAE